MVIQILGSVDNVHELRLAEMRMISRSFVVLICPSDIFMSEKKSDIRVKMFESTIFSELASLALKPAITPRTYNNIVISRA